MNKQSKTIYIFLMNRIAIALMLNQGIMAVLGVILSAMKEGLGEGSIIVLFCECIMYFIGFSVPIFVFNRMNNNAEVEVYEPKESEKMPPLQTVFAFFTALGGTVVAAYLNSFLVGFLGNYSDFTAELFWKSELGTLPQILMYFVYVAVIPAFVEEYLFRWTICKNLAVYGKSTAIIISAILFALMHANIEQILYTFVAGVLLAWVYLETKNIAFPILIHFVNNGISAIGDIISARLGEKASETYLSYTDAIILILTIISVIGLGMYFKKKGRLIEKTVLKPDENGNEVALLSIEERVSGFFSISMVLFVLYSVITMLGLILLSTAYG